MNVTVISLVLTILMKITYTGVLGKQSISLYTAQKLVVFSPTSSSLVNITTVSGLSMANSKLSACETIFQNSGLVSVTNPSLAVNLDKSGQFRAVCAFYLLCDVSVLQRANSRQSTFCASWACQACAYCTVFTQHWCDWWLCCYCNVVLHANPILMACLSRHATLMSCISYLLLRSRHNQSLLLRLCLGLCTV